MFMHSKDESVKGWEQGGEAGSLSTRSGTMFNLIKEVAGNTGCQGVPNIKRARSVVKKLFWLFIVMGGVGMMIWKITEAVDKYYSYPVDTRINYMLASELSFPAVTICNLNPIRQSALEYCGKDISDLMKKMDKGDSPMAADIKGNMSFMDWDTTQDSEKYYEEADANHEAREHLIASWSMMDPSCKWRAGHNLTMMMMSCSFAGKKCSPRNFTQFSNCMYGNCFTFNAGGWNTELGLDIANVGPMYGLSLELYVEQDEYLPLTDSAGFRVVVHNQTHMPFPEDIGFSVSVGLKTTVGIKRAEITRAEPLHGNCKRFTNEANKKINGFINELPHISYTTGACTKTCFQQHVLKECGCFDSKYPFSENITAYSDIARNLTEVGPCKYNDKINQSCETGITKMFAANKLGCSDMCPTECFRVEYDYSMSTARYPAKEALGECLQKVQTLSPDLFDEITKMTDVQAKDFIQENVVKMEIYYEDMNYECIVTASSYGSMELFSDLGGQTGLWLGLSIIALFELVELIFDIICLVAKQLSGKAQIDKNSRGEENGNFSERGENPKLADRKHSSADNKLAPLEHL